MNDHWQIIGCPVSGMKADRKLKHLVQLIFLMKNGFTAKSASYNPV